MPVYPVNMSEELYSKAQKYAANRDITLAEAIRQFMRNELSNPTPTEQIQQLQVIAVGSARRIKTLEKTMSSVANIFNSNQSILDTHQKSLDQLSQSDLAILNCLKQLDRYLKMELKKRG